MGNKEEERSNHRGKNRENNKQTSEYMKKRGNEREEKDEKCKIRQTKITHKKIQN